MNQFACPWMPAIVQFPKYLVPTAVSPAACSRIDRRVAWCEVFRSRLATDDHYRRHERKGRSIQLLCIPVLYIAHLAIDVCETQRVRLDIGRNEKNWLHPVGAGSGWLVSRLEGILGHHVIRQWESARVFRRRRRIRRKELRLMLNCRLLGGVDGRRECQGKKNSQA